MNKKHKGTCWNTLTAEDKKKIKKGLSQLKAGKGIPSEKLTSYLQKKYSINHP